jgi:two-component system response regulator RegX3
MKRLLLVDDDPIVLIALGARLKQYFDVDTAPDGTIGLDMFMNERHDIVISDNQMPGMTGLELCNRIAAKTHFYLISSEHIDLAALCAGAKGYFSKDNFDELLETLCFIERTNAYSNEQT